MLHAAAPADNAPIVCSPLPAASPRKPQDASDEPNNWTPPLLTHHLLPSSGSDVQVRARTVPSSHLGVPVTRPGSPDTWPVQTAEHGVWEGIGHSHVEIKSSLLTGGQPRPGQGNLISLVGTDLVFPEEVSKSLRLPLDYQGHTQALAHSKLSINACSVNKRCGSVHP